MPTYVYISTMNSPASTIDFPNALAARATNVDIISDEDCEQTFVGTLVVVKLGVVTFFGTLISCQLGVQNGMLWYFYYNIGIDEEDVLISELSQHQKLYLKEPGDD